MLNWEVETALNVVMPGVGLAALTAVLSGNRRATDMVEAHVSDIRSFADRDWVVIPSDAVPTPPHFLGWRYFMCWQCFLIRTARHERPYPPTSAKAVGRVASNTIDHE